MPLLSAYLNVYNTALVPIREKGFVLSHFHDRDAWYAQKGEWEFMADDPMQLLGLISIYEHHKPVSNSEYWWKIDCPDVLNELDPEVR